MSEFEPLSTTAGMPVVTQPTGIRYFVGTWSGRILLLNTLVFIFICIKTGSVLLPDTETLLALGAKDPVRLCAGEYWRLITPIFIHIGIIHFAFNSYFLYVVGYQLEKILGGRWFLATYLLSGLAGNIASAVFSVNLSAGASSSLFGLLGAGFFLERTIGRRIREVTGRRPRNRAYAMTVGINLLFGFIVPFIDNAAHLGGLVAGTTLTFAMVNLRPNNLQKPRKALGLAALVVLAVVCGVGTYFGSSPRHVSSRLEAAGDKADDPEERIYHYTQALNIDPKDPEVRLKRARELFTAGEGSYALQDVQQVAQIGGRDVELEKLADDLETAGHASEAWQVRQLVAHAGVPQ